jgi:anti-sigma factor RsiW
LGRSLDRHIDNRELNGLVPSSTETAHELSGLSPDAIREAERHVLSCVDCSTKVSKYWQLVNRTSNAAAQEAAAPGSDCPRENDVDWHEVAAGLWPELKARQLIMHAALCDHCGPLLRAATSVVSDPTPQEENLPEERKTSSPPGRTRSSKWALSLQWPLMKWVVPTMALLVIVGILKTTTSTLSGPKFAEFAVTTHRQHAQGILALDLRSDSMQTVNEWFKTKLQFPLSLPASPLVPGEEQPYRLEGARLVQVRGKTAAYISYRMQKDAASLIVTPDSVAVASGGVEVKFTKLSFHYSMVEGYKVVTWSSHGLTYALVSEEGNRTQRSCMVCHSAMKDRDLSQTPTPLHARGNAIESILQ